MKLLLVSLVLLVMKTIQASTTFNYYPQFDKRVFHLANVHSVNLAGTFNGWSKNSLPMERQSDGSYTLTIDLNPGIYHYKFVINGHFWLEDLYASNKLRQDDGTYDGGFNSGIQVFDSNNIKDIPDWARDAVWYQIFPERFRNGNPNNDPKIEDLLSGEIPGWQIKSWTSDWYKLDPWEIPFGGFEKSVFQRRYGGDLLGIIEKLDYLKELGINAIYLNPVFESPSLHKYDGSSFHHIDVTLGPDPVGDRKMIDDAQETDDPSTWVWTKADKLFLKLIKEIHKRGMKVIIDGVFNHSGRYFFAFQDVLKNKQRSHYHDWYDIKNWNANNEDGIEYTGWFGHKSLPEFKEYETGFSPGYFYYLLNITKRWMAPNGNVKDGIDGWRLDVAFCVNHGFWKQWRKQVKDINSDAYITAELWEESPEYLQGDEFDALMNYPFAHSLVEFVVDKEQKISASEYDRRITITRNSYPKQINGILQNVLSSHDTPRLRSLVVNPDMHYRSTSYHFEKSKILSNNSYNISRGSELDRQIHKLMALMQMTGEGAPMVYYGDEVGMTGANDPDCRKPMLWSDMDYEDERVHPVPYFSRPIEKNIVDSDLFNHYKALIKLRHDYVSLRRGSYSTFHIGNLKGTYGFVRQYYNEKVYIIINSSEERQKVTLELPEGKYLNLLTNSSFSISNTSEITLEAKTGLIFTSMR